MYWASHNTRESKREREKRLVDLKIKVTTRDGAGVYFSRVWVLSIDRAEELAMKAEDIIAGEIYRDKGGKKDGS